MTHNYQLNEKQKKGLGNMWGLTNKTYNDSTGMEGFQAYVARAARDEESSNIEEFVKRHFKPSGEYDH